MLKAIFYARFHHDRGPSIIHQYPHGSISSSTPSTLSGSEPIPKPLVNWSDISAYIIPPYDVCNQPLSICTQGYRILGYPVSLEDPKYIRNRLTFNVGFVIAEKVPRHKKHRHHLHQHDPDHDHHEYPLEDEDDTNDPFPSPISWDSLVRKTAEFFSELELEDGLLQAEEDLPGLKWADDIGYPAAGIGIIHDLLSNIHHDLNTYGETCLPVLGSLHVLNLRLSSSQPSTSSSISPSQPDHPVHAWDVPILIRDLPNPNLWTWDITLQRIAPYINGLNHIQRIAESADVEVRLVRRAIRELVLLNRVRLIDLFHSHAVYACTPELVCFVKDPALQDECRHYVYRPPSTSSTQQQPQLHSPQGDESTTPKAPSTTPFLPSHHPHLPSRQLLIDLYTSLSHGLSISDFCRASSRSPHLLHIDIRRFITFGILKGFLIRLHRYLLTSTHPQLRTTIPLSTSFSSPQTSSSLPHHSHLHSKSSISPSLPKSSSAASSLGTTTPGGTSSKPRRSSSISYSTRQQQQHQQRSEDRAWRRAALTSGWATPPSASASASNPSLSSSVDGGGSGAAVRPQRIPGAKSAETSSAGDQIKIVGDDEAEDEEDEETLLRYMNGKDPLDRACVELHMSEKSVMEAMMRVMMRRRERGAAGVVGGGSGGRVGGGGGGEVVTFVK